MRVLLLKGWRGRPAGGNFNFYEGVATLLIRRGIAKRADEPTRHDPDDNPDDKPKGGAGKRRGRKTHAVVPVEVAVEIVDGADSPEATA